MLYHEVVEMKKEMCRRLGCKGCPIIQAIAKDSTIKNPMSCLEYAESFPKEFEHIIVKWYKENPANSTKKLKDVFFEKFPNGQKKKYDGTPATCAFLCGLVNEKQCEEFDDCFACWNSEYMERR